MHTLLVQLPGRGADTDRNQEDPRVFLIRRAPAWAGLFLVLLAACSGSTDFENAFTLDVRDGSAQKTLPRLATDQKYFLLPFSAPSQALSGSATYTLSMEMQGTRSPSTASSTLVTPPAPTAAGLLTRRIAAETERNRLFDAQIRSAYELRRSDPARFERFFRRFALEPAVVHADLSTTLPLYSPFSGEEGQQITGLLRGNTQSVAIYVDSRDSDKVTDDQVKALLAAYDTITLPRIHALFGSESDIDNNGVVIVFLAAASRLGEGQLGFFRPVDLLPDGTVGGSRSNEGEIIYSQIPSFGVSIPLVNATLAHETFHLVNFAQKSLPFFQASVGHVLIQETLWLNEGQAHLAEEVTGWSSCTPHLVEIYLECMSHTSVAGPGATTVTGNPDCNIAGPGDDSLARRGGTMLFLLYMFQQLGGAAYSDANAGDISGAGVTFLRRLSSSAMAGVPNLEYASGRSFFSWYADFISMVALDGTVQNFGSRFQLTPEAQDSFTQLTRNVRLRSTRQDENGAPVVLHGPADIKTADLDSSSEVSGTLFSSGANAVLVSVPAFHDFTVRISGDPSLAMGLAIVPAL
ncbi:MAG: hypothetical protein V1798_11455 [Pseudomonadota bacterium]